MEMGGIGVCLVLPILRCRVYETQKLDDDRLLGWITYQNWRRYWTCLMQPFYDNFHERFEDTKIYFVKYWLIRQRFLLRVYLWNYTNDSDESVSHFNRLVGKYEKYFNELIWMHLSFAPEGRPKLVFGISVNDGNDDIYTESNGKAERMQQMMKWRNFRYKPFLSSNFRESLFNRISERKAVNDYLKQSLRYTKMSFEAQMVKKEKEREEDDVHHKCTKSCIHNADAIIQHFQLISFFPMKHIPLLIGFRRIKQSYLLRKSHLLIRESNGEKKKKIETVDEVKTTKGKRGRRSKDVAVKKAKIIEETIIPKRSMCSRNVEGFCLADYTDFTNVYHFIEYVTPCGLRLYSTGEVAHFLEMANADNVQIEMFSFDAEYDCTSVHYFSDDIYFDKWIKTNEYVPQSPIIYPMIRIENDLYEEMRRISYNYVHERLITKNVPKETFDEKFLCSCSCTDDCSDVLSCECQQLTFEGTSIYKPLKHLPFYSGGRLSQLIPTAVFECNKNCSCKKNRCQNRVSQKTELLPCMKIERTSNKGLGVFAQERIERGTLLGTYHGLLLTDDDGDFVGLKYGDEYMADLNFCELSDILHRHQLKRRIFYALKARFKKNETLLEECIIKFIDSDELRIMIRGNEPHRNNEIERQELRKKTQRHKQSLDHYRNESVIEKEEMSEDDEDEISTISTPSTPSSSEEISSSSKIDDDEIECLNITIDNGEMSQAKLKKDAARLYRERAAELKVARLKTKARKLIDTAIDTLRNKLLMSFHEYLRKEYYTIDAKRYGSLGRFFNHSCDPNAFIQNVFVDTHDVRFPWIVLFAARTIEVGEEICWNYNYSEEPVEGKRVDCLCGAKKCVGRLL
ncbi:hypothetical protein SNEBB_006025 [Seison nebaliae]|nr:hypothetical protein SNEBB_006025 [Seison nebaliae]